MSARCHNCKMGLKASEWYVLTPLSFKQQWKSKLTLNRLTVGSESNLPWVCKFLWDPKNRAAALQKNILEIIWKDKKRKWTLDVTQNAKLVIYIIITSVIEHWLSVLHVQLIFLFFCDFYAPGKGLSNFFHQYISNQWMNAFNENILLRQSSCFPLGVTPLSAMKNQTKPNQ